MIELWDDELELVEAALLKARNSLLIGGREHWETANKINSILERIAQNKKERGLKNAN